MRIKLDHLKLVLYVCLMLLVVKPVVADVQKEFVIKSVNTQLNDSVYFLNAVFEINLPEYMIYSFEQGFVLPLAMEIEVSRKRGFWFNEDVVTIKQQYRIQYHVFRDLVSLFNVNAGNRLYFSSLKETLNQLTVLLNYPLLDNNALNQSESYIARLSFGIDNAELPIPLKSSSLLKNDWNITSDWYEWDVTQ